MRMSKIFTMAIPVIVLMCSAMVRGQDRPAPLYTTHHDSVEDRGDSIMSRGELLPITLEFPGDTLETARSSLLPLDRSWLAAPDTMRPAPSLKLLFEMPQPVLSDHEASPFQRESWLLQSRANLMSPWKLQMQSNEKYRIWRTIFGSIQAGGMAYLMYLHFKKYGLK